jgi:hypothetical protein
MIKQEKCAMAHRKTITTCAPSAASGRTLPKSAHTLVTISRLRENLPAICGLIQKPYRELSDKPRARARTTWLTVKSAGIYTLRSQSLDGSFCVRLWAPIPHPGDTSGLCSYIPALPLPQLINIVFSNTGKGRDTKDILGISLGIENCHGLNQGTGWRLLFQPS